MNESDRRNLLRNYMETEPEIFVNCEPYKITVAYEHPDYIIFFATSLFQRTVGAITKVVRSTWEAIDCGLKMAYTYNIVLETLEMGVKQTGGSIGRYEYR